MFKPRWSDKDVEFVKDNFSTVRTIEIARVLNRTIHSVRHKAVEIGLKKTPKYKSSIHFGPKASYSLDHVTTEDAVYVAGLFDGEGWFHFYWQPPKRTSATQGLRVAIGNTDGETLRSLKAIFKLGCICSPKNKKGGKPMTQWYMTGWQAICFLKKIVPFLRIRKLDAINAIRKWEEDRGCISWANLKSSTVIFR